MANEDVKKLSDDVGELKAGFTRIAETLADLVRQRGQEAAARFQSATEDTWVEAKQRLDSYGQAGGERLNAAHRQQHAGHEGGAVQGVVTDGQRLAMTAE